MVEPVFAALTRLESRILKQGVVIVQPEAWPEVTGVETWLETVWWNLIANALSHGGGGIRIELGWRLDAAQWFWVRDDGPGVLPDKRDKMFQPFHQLQEPNAPRGLGLPIVQRLVELQGGRCQYQSPAEGGSCFSFSLPLAI
jgi:signal transduction histidine kinase